MLLYFIMSNAYRGPAPYFLVSNEVWTDAALAAARNQTSGNAAVVIGQAHAPSVLPHLSAHIDKIAFVDMQPGHAETFAAKMRALEAMPEDSRDYAHYANSTAAVLADQGITVAKDQMVLLEGEAHSFFDAGRPGNPLAVAVNPETRSTLLQRYSSAGIEAIPQVGHIEQGLLPKRIGKMGNLSWVHLSNVAETTQGRVMGRLMIEFMEQLDGINDNTLVTYAAYDFHHNDELKPSVHAARPSDITPDLLLETQETFVREFHRQQAAAAAAQM
jgi:hypothetical protein